MTDDKPDLTKTEARQGNSRMMNSRVLIYGLVAVVVLLAAVYWFSTTTYDETATTTDGGATLEDVPAADYEMTTELDALPTPAPTEEAVTEPETPVEVTPPETAPAAETPAAETPAEAAPAEDDAPADAPVEEETETPAAQ
ncbi:MAG: hypothetical protein RIB57_09425 [Pelagibacterium sp.]|uniref:hypothetical protein n=1 Tax=Pelagibacterium sp. TaxID=1967288 RepID=UPI0032EAAAE9